MVLMTGELVIILMSIIFIISIVRKIKKHRKLNLLSDFLFFISIYLIFSYYFMPFPITWTGYKAIGDALLPLNEAITLLPFTNMLFDIKHADALYYFIPIIPMMSGAALLGFSLPSFLTKIISIKHLLIVSLSIPIVLFSIHVVLRLLTGIMWKRADITDIIWFVLAFWLGFGFYHLETIFLLNNDKKNTISP